MHGYGVDNTWTWRHVDKNTRDGRPPFAFELDPFGQLQFMYVTNLGNTNNVIRRGRYVGKTWFMDVIEMGSGSYSGYGSWFHIDQFGVAHCLISRNSTAWPINERRLVYRNESHFLKDYESWTQLNYSAEERVDNTYTSPSSRGTGQSLTNA